MSKETRNPKNTAEENRLRNNIDDARKEWDKITKAEFVELDGSREKLTKLVGSRYNLGAEIAKKQVNNFFDIH